MKLNTQRKLIQTVARNWREQYQPFHDDGQQQIADRLDALDGDTATAEDVSAIIGNESWTRLKCDECKADVMLTVQVGEEPDYESHTAELCIACVQKAVALIQAPQ